MAKISSQELVGLLAKELLQIAELEVMAKITRKPNPQRVTIRLKSLSREEVLLPKEEEAEEEVGVEGHQFPKASVATKSTRDLEGQDPHWLELI